MRIIYYPGCTVKSTAIRYEKSARGVLEELGIELIEIKDWTCCGAVYNLPTDTVAYTVAPLRNLIRAQETAKREGAEHYILTLCSMCNHTLRQADLRYRTDIDGAERLRRYMDDEPEYEKSMRVIHLLELIREFVGYDKIREKVKRSLRGLKVATFYGCLLLRPREVAIDDPEDPTIMEDILLNIGAEPVDYPNRNECCGSYNVVRNPDAVWDRVKEIAESAIGFGAKAFVTTCPLCAFNLEEGQKSRSRELRGKFLPVFYVSELLAYALGMNEYIEKEVLDWIEKLIG